MPDRPASARQRGPGVFFSSLGVRLFLWLFGGMLVVIAGYAWLNIRTTSAQWQQVTVQAARRKSELIKRSTHHAMLLNRKEDVDQIIRMIAEGPGVSGVRIYDKGGTIIVSGVPEEVGRQVDLRAEACVICHVQETPLTSVPAESRVRIYRDPGGGRVLGLIDPIENAPECSSAPCHFHPASQTVLGVLDVKMSMEYADAGLQSAVRGMIAATAVLTLLIGIVSALFIYRVILVPVRQLIRGTERIAQGELDVHFENRNRDEIGKLAGAFNRMTADLRRARKEITDWSRTLERKVEEKTEELGRAQQRIVHMEKMASLGKLSATVAHELNNPLAGVLTYAKLLDRSLKSGELRADDPEETTRFLDLIRKETSRCGDIVRNLLLFARRSGGHMEMQHLNPIVEHSLMLIRHHMEMSGARLDRRLLEGDDLIPCDAAQIEQALVAMMVNGVEAMPSGGTLTVHLDPLGDDEVRLEISDTGVGIPPDVLPHVFEPFFSTKEGKNGVGLGLAVVYGIVQRHGGRIDVESRPQQGTSFVVRLPRRRQETAETTKENEPCAARA